MRADRLVAALLVLQARGRVTAAQLAAELEVSTRTARRDLEALASAGIPVWSQSGRGGGWSLVGGARTDLTGLTEAEARALFLLVGPSTALEPQARAALRKLVQALPAPFRERAHAAAGAVAVDPAAWGESERATPPHLEVLRDAVVDGRRVRIDYRDRAGTETRRDLSPLGVVDKDGTWYLLAEAEAGRRTFRVDRVREVAVLDESTTRPEGFDLSTAWDEVVVEVEQRRRAVRATVVVAARDLRLLRRQLGTDLEVLGPRDDGRVAVLVAAPAAEQVAWQVAGWGDRLEVEGPSEVRVELARIGRELVAAHASAATGADSDTSAVAAVAASAREHR